MRTQWVQHLRGTVTDASPVWQLTGERTVPAGFKAGKDRRGAIEGMMEVTVHSVHSSLRKTYSITMHSGTKKNVTKLGLLYHRIMMMGE